MIADIPFKNMAMGEKNVVVTVLVFLFVCFFQNILWLQIVEINILFSLFLSFLVKTCVLAPNLE